LSPSRETRRMSDKPVVGVAVQGLDRLFAI
jgi:hypothetical protein